MPGFSGIGFGEMLVIGMLVLIVFGPRRLPEISRSMGKAIREFKRGMNEIQRELDVADRESRWGTAGSRAASAASGAAVSRPTDASKEEPGDQAPEPTIAPPPQGAVSGAASGAKTPEDPAPEHAPRRPGAARTPSADRASAPSRGERPPAPDDESGVGIEEEDAAGDVQTGTESG